MLIFKKSILSVLLLFISLTSTLAQNTKMEWWRDARFGMFIHFGPYAQFGGFYHGHPQKVKNAEWLFNRMKVPVQEYKDTTKNFNPVKYNAEEWVLMAKNAGMKYLVITAKHHDGFALFDTKTSDWSIMKASPYGKDMLKPLAEACRKHGLKFGLYYSQAQDWGNPGGATDRRPMTQGWNNPDSAKIDAYTKVHRGSWDPAQQTKTYEEYFRTIALPQVKELLTSYGDIMVFFWDTPRHEHTELNKEMLNLVTQLQSKMIQNDRLGLKGQGDYKTPEQKIPNLSELDGKDWETNMTMNDTWGYRKDDHNWKSTEDLIRKLTDIASKGGNFLLNIGPKPDGTFPQESIDRLKAVGAWMKKYSDAIYGTHANPVNTVDWGRITAKDINGATTLYLSVFNWPANGTLQLSGLRNKALKAEVLGKKANITLKQDANGNLTISGLSANAPDKIASVIAIKLDGLAKKVFNQKKDMNTGSID